MTVKEVILEKLNKQSTYQEVTDYIKNNELYISDGKTLEATVSALLGDFIRKNDTRIGRLKEGRTYFYYLTKNQLENKIDLPNIEQRIDKKPKIDFYERDLHPLFVSYLKSQNIFSKTILHEESKNSRDETQKWVHPDIVGVKGNPGII